MQPFAFESAEDQESKSLQIGDQALVQSNVTPIVQD